MHWGALKDLSGMQRDRLRWDCDHMALESTQHVVISGQSLVRLCRRFLTGPILRQIKHARISEVLGETSKIFYLLR